jgi:hypothetical protein
VAVVGGSKSSRIVAMIAGWKDEPRLEWRYNGSAEEVERLMIEGTLTTIMRGRVPQEGR